MVSDGTEKVLWFYDGASQGWTKGEVRVNAAIFIFDELPYQVRRKAGCDGKIERELAEQSYVMLLFIEGK